MVINGYAQEQIDKVTSNNSLEFSSMEKMATNKYKLEVIFSNVTGKEDMNNIIHVVKSIHGVESIELFYPTTNNGIIILSEVIMPSDLIEKLNSINIQLDPKSLKQQY